jgi:glutathione synthase/RimK-type ligase-like ATP-grasp enzyme
VETLPDEIAAACIALTRGFGLKFAAIDLARRIDGGHTFFEINPNGQWAWIEQRTSLRIAAGLAELLESA